MPLGPRLIVADQVAGTIRILDLGDGHTTARLDGRHLAEHAGFLALPGNRLAFVDDRAGELLVLDPYGPESGRPVVEHRVPVAVPAEHLAAGPSGRRIAVTTGLGRNPSAWCDQLTAVDLAAEGGPGAVRVRTRTGEPGVALCGSPDDPLVVLRHREPGQLTAYRHTALMDAAPSCPPAEPAFSTPLPDDDGHGDAYDPVTGWVFAAARSGVHRVRPDGDALAFGSLLPWAAGGRTGGRGFYLRLDARHRTLWSCVRGGPSTPERWPDWTNDAWWHHLDSGDVGRLHLGPGLIFRLAVAADHVAFSRVHPEGDELILVATSQAAPVVTARLPLLPMAAGPRPGHTPWDGVERRAIAASPAASLVAVSRGGHGEIHVFDAEMAQQTDLLTVPTPLCEGGHLALLTPDDRSHLDPIGR
ncbi:hypothetical protein ACIQNG_26465 [Streptomyces sp. NPDC091377]|uniref:hypothetical protein n=1 Tax=Streptomyces sp. NPDC091377 TaxID=3365995 RepID=UPI00380F8DCD